MGILRYRFSFFLMLVLFSQTTFAKVLNVVTEEFPDYQYLNGKGELIGSAADIVRQVLNLSQVQYEISLVNWAIAYNAVLRRPDTCLFSVARLPTREEQFLWMFPVGKFTTSFYGLKSAKIKINSLEDAKKYKTAVIRNNYSHLYLLENGFSEEKQLILISSFDNVFNLISTRKESLDLVILSDAQYRYREEHGELSEPLEKLYTLQDGLSELYFVCNRETEQPTVDKIVSSYRKQFTNMAK